MSNRLDDIAEGPHSPTSLVGSYFHGTYDRSWQGCVVAEPSPGVYLVELFSWSMGQSTEQRLVSLSEMSGWAFYDDADWMRNSTKAVELRWERERSETASPDG